MNYEAVLADMVAVAREAGALTLRHFARFRELEIGIKGPADFVSDADRESEQLIRKYLFARYPDWSFTGEEFPPVDGTDREHRWLVDPIDGTTNFINGQHYTISIALRRGNETVCGVLYNPVSDEMFTAVHGQGAYLNGERLSVSRQADVGLMMVGTGLPTPNLSLYPGAYARLDAIRAPIGAVRIVGSAALEIAQHYPQPGWVEHDAEEIWRSVGAVVLQALALARLDAGAIAAIGITNQRETTLLWERATSRPVAPAIVWQDRRTTDFCRSHAGDEPWLRERTGLVLDPYFAATKLAWLLDQDAARRTAAAAGQLAAGTIDSFLIWQLTGGRVHATDRTNACRTLLLNLQTAAWDEELCKYFRIPRQLLPEVKPSAADFGSTHGLDFLPDGIPILGVAGDQQAALFGQCAFSPGEAKCTYGTGAFFLLNIGTQPALSRCRLLTSIAATADAAPQYALEGSVFIAGAAVQWLRDGMKFFARAEQVEALAEQSDDQQPVIFVPALVGLGAPHWVPEARGVLFGITRGTTGAELARAALEGVAFQVADLVAAANDDAAQPLAALRVDGGMARNAWFVQRQADILGLPVLQSAQSESTALGAAFLAGLKAGIWPDLTTLRSLAHEARRFEPTWDDPQRQRRLTEWRRAVAAVIGFYQGT